MTESEWLACENVRKLIQSVFVSNLHSFHEFGEHLGLLKPSQIDRRYRLFACNSLRQVWDRISPVGQFAVELAEQFVDGEATYRDLVAIRARIHESVGIGRFERWTHSLAEVLFRRPAAAGISVTQRSARFAAFSSASEFFDQLDIDEGPTFGRSLSYLFREIFGNPFRPVTLNAYWLTSTVLALANGIYSDRAFERMPILADSLQDAGCDNEDILNHCREQREHLRGCWVVDLLTGRG
jgi:hypothetical protein